MAIKGLKRCSLAFLLSLALVASANADSPRKKVVVFDIDDTLMDSNYRTNEILHEVGQELQIESLAALTFDRTDFFCSKSVQNAGITDAALISKICGNFPAIASSEWGKRFFSSEYLKYDHILPGAKQFVDRIQEETGADIVFLTGRPEDKMGEGTRAQLKYFSLLGQPGRSLITRSARFSEDVGHKRDAIRKLLQDSCVIGSFDDSSSNNAMFMQELGPSVPIIKPERLLNTNDLSARPIRITNYFYDLEKTAEGSAISKANKARLDKIIDLMKAVPCSN